jgi:DNA-binding MarR family transcriptional regulator
MGLMDRFTRRKYNLPKNSTFRLTQEGKEKLQSYSGTPQARILAALETNGTSDADEIAHTSGLGRGRVEKEILILMQKGFIQRTGGATRLEDTDLGDMD